MTCIVLNNKDVKERVKLAEIRASLGTYMGHSGDCEATDGTGINIAELTPDKYCNNLTCLS